MPTCQMKIEIENSYLWNFGHWRKRGVTEITPIPFYGSFPSMVTKKRAVIYDQDDIYRKYHQDEDFVGVYSIRSPELMVLNPEFVHKVFVTDFKSFQVNEMSTWINVKKERFFSHNPFSLKGDAWKERRQEITFALTLNKIKSAYPVAQETSTGLIKYMKDKYRSTTAKEVNASELSLRYTSEVVTDSVLGFNAANFTDKPSPIFGTTDALFDKTTIFSIYAVLAGFWPNIKHIYKGRIFQKAHENFFTKLIGSAFDAHQQQRMNRGDFLSYIIQMREKKDLSLDDIVGHTMTFLLDGYTTSAMVMSLCLYQLAKYPNEQEKIFIEIQENLNSKGKLDFEKLDTMTYLEQCIHESMRLTPLNLFWKKICTEPIVFTNSKSGKNLLLKPGDVVRVPIYSFCHDEQYFPNPEEFIPDRFSPENGGVKKYRDMGVFLPFGDGPRTCMGIKFALTHIKAAIAEIVKNFTFKLNSRTRRDILYHPTFVFANLVGGIWLDFEERK
ncbi:probable cytochrome P450 28d1 [Episyrphus balteatus]|uniref:probable cytochrome P450 28d1 n=1 Tax=Episyrphus balteatus TaxID=286459 RepID=UPI00248533BF|nr:probable cytochrome P450 28d1 [Episyrphus balteatus]